MPSSNKVSFNKDENSRTFFEAVIKARSSFFTSSADLLESPSPRQLLELASSSVSKHFFQISIKLLLQRLEQVRPFGVDGMLLLLRSLLLLRPTLVINVLVHFFLVDLVCLTTKVWCSQNRIVSSSTGKGAASTWRPGPKGPGWAAPGWRGNCQ